MTVESSIVDLTTANTALTAAVLLKRTALTIAVNSAAFYATQAAASAEAAANATGVIDPALVAAETNRAIAAELLKADRASTYTKVDVDAKFEILRDFAPDTLDTLGKLATQVIVLENDINEQSIIIANKAPAMHSHGDASTSNSGFLSSAEKVKLAGISPGATVGVLPSASLSGYGITDAYTINQVNARFDTLTISGVVDWASVTSKPIFGTAALVNTSALVSASDSRLTDARSPLSHNHTKSEVGLGDVDNVSDINKPVSLAQAIAISVKADITALTVESSRASAAELLKADKSNTYTKPEIDLLLISAGNGTGAVSSVAGRIGDVLLTKVDVGLANADNTSDTNKPVSLLSATAISLAETNARAASTPIAHATNTSNPHAVTKTQIGLPNVDNTSDINKPVSTLQSASLDLKASVINLNSEINRATGVEATKANIIDVYTKAESDAIALSSGLVSSVAGRAGNVILTKADVGLSFVDNTSDLNKPVSTAQATSIALKSDQITTYTKLETDAAIQSVVGAAPAALNTLQEIATLLSSEGSAVAALTTVVALKSPIDSPTFTGTVGGITKSMVGLANVDNTADIDKPVSTLQATALALKASVINLQSEIDRAVASEALKASIDSPTFTGTVGGITKSMVGLANIDNTTDINKPVSTLQAAADLADQVIAAIDASTKANAAQAASTPIEHATNISNPHSVTKTQVGLGSVDNTSDLLKPISTATISALVLKADIATLTTETNRAIAAENLKANQSTTYTKTEADAIAAASGLVSSVAGRAGDVILTKIDVGLSNVDDTSDVNKPVSTLQVIANTVVLNAAAIDATTKANAAIVSAETNSTPITHVGSNGNQHSNVTTTISGFMSYIDKTKLDGIAPGATSNANPMTTIGDMIYGGVNGIPTRIAHGSPGQVLSLTLVDSVPTWSEPIKGENGAAGTVSINSVSTGPAGSSVSIINNGTVSAASLDIIIPRGSDGLTKPNSLLIAPKEKWFISPNGSIGIINLDIETTNNHYYRGFATGNCQLNIRGSSTVTANSILLDGESITVVFLNKCGPTPFYPNQINIDGVLFTPVWSGGVAPAAGNSSSTDSYVYVIIKISSGVYDIVANYATAK